MSCLSMSSFRRHSTVKASVGECVKLMRRATPAQAKHSPKTAAAPKGTPPRSARKALSFLGAPRAPTPGRQRLPGTAQGPPGAAQGAPGAARGPTGHEGPRAYFGLGRFAEAAKGLSSFFGGGSSDCAHAGSLQAGPAAAPTAHSGMVTELT